MLEVVDASLPCAYYDVLGVMSEAPRYCEPTYSELWGESCGADHVLHRPPIKSIINSSCCDWLGGEQRAGGH